jgi:mono/diheme cytochrome c family protein
MKLFQTAHRPVRMAVLTLCSVIVMSGCSRIDSPDQAQSVELDDRGKQGSVAPAHGEKLFTAYCAACHHRGGEGLNNRVPPLVNSPWVSGSEDRLIRIVLNGLRGPIEIDGEMYNLEMPAFGMLFKDDDIANILTYVRRRYESPSPPVATKTVARVRKETRGRSRYWTVEELLQVP